MKKLIATLAIGVATVVGFTATAGATESKREKWSDYATEAEGHLATISSDATAVSEAADSGSVSGVEAACETFGDDVDTATPVLTHSPSKRLNRLMRLALTSYSTGADECASGDYVSAASSMEVGTSFVEDASDHIDEVKADLGV